MIVKRPAAKPLGKSDDLPEGIFGITDDEVPDTIKLRKKAQRVRDKKRLQIEKRKAERVRKQKPRVMPEMEINYNSVLPREAEGLKIDNVVDIPVELLKNIGNVTQSRTRSLSKLLLLSATPSALAYDAASAYVKAALSDGLKIDVDIDKGVLEVINDVSRLDVIYFFVKRLKLPAKYKQQFMATFITELSKSALEGMKRVDKSNTMSDHIRELEGVIARRSNSKLEHRSVKKKETSEEEGPLGMPSAIRKRRR